jgi:nitrate/nitrite transporter NarK
MFICCLCIGSVMSDNNVSFMSLAVLSCVGSGMGGGVFASSMPNISPYFPKRLAGVALGLNAGIGNLGTSIMQLTIPLVMAAGSLGVATIPAVNGTSHPQNAGWFWAIPLGFALCKRRCRARACVHSGAVLHSMRVCLVRVVSSFIVMNTMPRDGKSYAYNLGMFWYMNILGYVGCLVGAAVQIAVIASGGRRGAPMAVCCRCF